MTTAALAPPPARAEPGSRRFIATLSMCMAVTALAIDAILPAFADIRASLGLADDATEVTGLITAFFLGNSLGLVPAGMIADRVGRRPVMWGGLALYAVGAVGALLAPGLGWMLLARFVWGVGASGPRVAALATVRDSFEGEQMARQMSFIMAIFLLVPAIAPALGSGILLVGNYQLVFAVCAVAAVAVAVLVVQLPETLSRSDVAPPGRVLGDIGTVLRAPGTVGYLVALTALFGAFLSYLASSEILIDQVYDLATWFPVIFGGVALVLGSAMVTNGRCVERFGLSLMIRFGLTVLGGSATALLGVALLFDGAPPFAVFVVLLSSALFGLQMTIPNLNTAAMRPLPQVAGSAAALFGMVPGVLGALLGAAVDRMFDGTVVPFGVALVAACGVATLGWRYAERSAARAR